MAGHAPTAEEWGVSLRLSIALALCSRSSRLRRVHATGINASYAVASLWLCSRENSSWRSTVTGTLDFREAAIMVCPPCEDRECCPVLDANRDGAAILARTSVGERSY